MDITDFEDSSDLNGYEDSSKPKIRPLPADLPTSLDDRKAVNIDTGIEVYDAWNGQAQYLTSTAQVAPFNFNLSIEEPGYEIGLQTPRAEFNDDHLERMVAAQAMHRRSMSLDMDEYKIATDKNISNDEKRKRFEGVLHTAASNGDVAKLKALLHGPAKELIDVDVLDDEGTAPLIYASCFGHEEIVTLLLNAGADVNKQDRHQWSSLMWATTNRHKAIVKILLDHGASPTAKSSAGRTAFDFVAPDNDISDYLHDNGYRIGSAGITNDFYVAGLSQDRFEDEMAENELKRRMMMESAMNLEVDLGNLGLDENPETPEEVEDGHEFVWDRCLNDQMFVFQEEELPHILNVVITTMTPQRSTSQKPVPANVLFLSARYAHYHARPDLLETLLVSAMQRINAVVERHQGDMTMLAFWMSNATLLLHYLKKDAGLSTTTPQFQLGLAELVNDIFALIIRDAERRMDKVLDTALLDHETIPGFEDVHFQNEWKIFRSKSKAKPLESLDKRFRPPSPKRKAQVSPRNVTSLLSSTLFVLDLYEVHSVIITQIMAQLLYWLGSELFNRIMSNRKYLARTKAMQVRMNVSILEDWARNNNRQPAHYENGQTTSTGQTTIDAARQHLAPLIQLLQWLQILTASGDSAETLQSTVEQLSRLSPLQLIHAAKFYRAEVGEKTLPRSAMKQLVQMQKQLSDRKAKQRQASNVSSSAPAMQLQPINTALQNPDDPTPAGTSPVAPVTPVFASQEFDDTPEAPENLLMDPSLMLPFSLPTSTDMLITYGAGFGGVNRERERKYTPSVPPDFLAKLDVGSNVRKVGMYDKQSWGEQDE